MKHLTTIITIICMMIAPALHAQEKYSRVKILPGTNHPATWRSFIHGALQVDHCTYEGNACIVEIGEREMNLLRSSSYQYEILVDDIATDFRLHSDVSRFYEADQQNRMSFITSCQQVANIIPTPSGFTPGAMGGYYTYSEMITKMTNLEVAYPGIVDMFSIGTTHEGRTIWCIKISDNVTTDENEPEALFNGLQHAREAITGMSLIFFMQYLAENYASDTRVTEIVNNREIYIIPCSNPDGYVYNQTISPGGGGNWRKNRRNNLDGTYGVDMNRNYSVDWSNCSAPISGSPASCGSGATSSDTYWGPSSFSEPETQAIRNLVITRNFKVAVDQHANGAYYSLPFGRPSLHTMDPVDDLVYTYTPALMGLYNCHRAGNSPESVGYEVAGGYKDWMLMGDIGTGTKQKIYGLTGEANGGSFWPGSSQIIPLCRELCFQDIQAAITAGSYADIQDQNDIALTTLSGNLSFLVRRVGITDAPIIVSIIPLSNIQNVGSPVTINTLTNYNDTYNGTISYTLPAALGNGQRIRFIWRVETGGVTTNDTITKFYNPVNIFYDDMETGAAGTRWTISGGWSYTSTQAYAGTRSLAESPSGDYTASTTARATYINTIDLSDATAAYLSFWVKHRAENCRDNLRIQLSANGGTSYTNLCGKNTIAENFSALGGSPGITGVRENWTRELVDLSSYTGNNNIRLRFEFVSNANSGTDPYAFQEDDGFYLDNVRMMKSTSTLVTLPAHFLSFEGRLIAAGTAELKWEAETDSRHDYFEVERSADRTTYISLGRIYAAPPYVFTDGSVQPGHNYYRIKQVDSDGRVTYSKIISIVYEPGKTNLVIYPNPVKNSLHIGIQADKPGIHTIVMSDYTGRKLYEQKLITGNTPAAISIDMMHKLPQVYILTVMNAQNEIVAKEKIVKQ